MPLVSVSIVMELEIGQVSDGPHATQNIGLRVAGAVGIDYFAIVCLLLCPWRTVTARNCIYIY